jgi:hypothetical protein
VSTQFCWKPRLTWVALIVVLGLMVSAHVRADPLADALDTPSWTWTNSAPGGGGLWTVDAVTTHDELDAARSGTPAYTTETQLETTLSGPGTVVFWAKASTPGGSYLVAEFRGLTSYYLQNADWRTYTLDVPVGAVTVSFRFVNWDFSGSAGDAIWVDNVRITLIDKPFITYEPVDATATEAQSAGFTVLAVGPEPITHQWYHSAPLAGQTNYWLQLASVQLGDTGNYFVVLSNSFDSTASRVAQLVVNGILPDG